MTKMTKPRFLIASSLFCAAAVTGVLLSTSSFAVPAEGPSLSGLHDAAKKAEPTPQEIKRIKVLREEAMTGDTGAMVLLGQSYYDGEGQTKDTKKAFEWYTKAFESGSPAGAYYASFFHLCGDHTALDEKKAADMVEFAAQRGFAEAQTQHARNLMQGRGLEKNTQEAMKWYFSAADKGDPDAMHNIGYEYHEGGAVTQNYEEAMKWFTLSADKGKAASMQAIGNMHHAGKGVPVDFKLAAKWFQAAHEKGDSTGSFNLGMLYEFGEGVEKDLKRAFQIYKEAAANGHDEALTKVGVLTYNGQGTKQDFALARKLITEAADKGVVNAQLNLGIAYENGKGTKANPTLAYALYSLAAANGELEGAKQRDELAGKLSKQQLSLAQSLSKEMYEARCVSKIIARHQQTGT